MKDPRPKPFREPVNGSRGAPLGRHSDDIEPGTRVRLERVPFVDGDYDQGGAYWGGSPEAGPLFCAWDPESRHAIYLRARDRAAAKRQAFAEHGFRFFR